MGAEAAGGGGGGAWTAAAGPSSQSRASALRTHASQSRGGGLQVAGAAQTDLSPGPRAGALGGRAACRVSTGLSLRRLSDTLNTYLGLMRRST